MAPTKSPQITIAEQNSHLVPAPPYPPGKLMCPPTASPTRQTSHASTECTAPPPPRLPGKPAPAHLEATRLGWQFNTAHSIYLAKTSGEGFCPQPAKLLFITWPRVGSINIRNEIRHPPSTRQTPPHIPGGHSVQSSSPSALPTAPATRQTAVPRNTPPPSKPRTSPVL